MLWRDFSPLKVYELCKPMTLPEGVLISHDFAEPVRYVQQAVYHQNCHHGATPLMNTNTNLVINTFLENLPIVVALWQEYTRGSGSGGSFLFSVAPIVYSMATLAVITWFLTIFVMTNYMIKPSLLLKTSVVMASVYMLIVVVKSIVVLHNQQRNGYLHGQVLLEVINLKTYLKVIDLFVTFFLQINQVQIIMRLFSRQSDKRLIFLVGLTTSIASQTLWSVSKFHSFADSAEAGKILPAFTYLIRIAMSISYAAIFTAFLITKIKTIMLYPNIWPISVLSLILIYTPVAFFISDVSSAWVYDLAEIFSIASYVVCVVIPWEWCNKYNVIRKIQEKEGVLGRKFYEDEIYELDKLELFVEEDSADESYNGRSMNRSLLSRRSLQSLRTAPSLSSTCHENPVKPRVQAVTENLGHGFFFIRDGFVKVTDFIIATGMAIPRSVS
ncbi:hypothetical protein METBIDRAFT_26691, partial [Metschnikowia bicuspidata var. bicuspidata NRRL YB-4993]